MKRCSIFAAVIFAAIAGGGNALAAETCTLVRAASVEMGTDSSGGVTVPVTIQGKPFNFLVDTGGIMSLITEDAAKAADLRQEYMREQHWMVMFGGAIVKKSADVVDFELGGLKADHMPLAVIPAGFQYFTDNVDGTLAPDILSAYDVEFDFANNKFNLYSKEHCPGQVVYWTSTPYAVIPIDMPDGFHIALNVMLDGKPFRAMIDTGSTRSILNMAAAESAFGLTDKDFKPVGDKSKSAPGKSDSASFFTYPFKSLSINGLAVNNPSLLTVPRSTSEMSSNGPEIILGMGILRQMHIYIAYGERNLYVTPASAH